MRNGCFPLLRTRLFRVYLFYICKYQRNVDKISPIVYDVNFRVFNCLKVWRTLVDDGRVRKSTHLLCTQQHYARGFILFEQRCLGEKFALYPALVPTSLETHGGEDVAVWARGPWAHLFVGSFEQNVLPLIMSYASCIGPNEGKCSNR